MRFKIFIFLSTIYCLLSTMMGCEAFVRKFTRKPKKPEIREELILVPQIYSEPSYTAHEMYKDGYLFFRIWIDELINHLEPGANRKKQINCLKEAKGSLLKMHSLLKEEKQKELTPYIQKLEDMEEQMKGYLTQDKFYRFKNQCMSLKIRVSKNFSYSKVKDFIK